MRVIGRNHVLALLACSLLGVGQAYAERPGAEIVTPRPGDSVARNAELVGKVNVRGWPLVLVRPDLPDGLWWVQQAAEPDGPGQFKASLQLGNDRTLAGSRFEVVVLMLPSAEARREFRVGKSLEKLPNDVPRSAQTRVTLDAPEAERQGQTIIVQPENHARVSPVESLVGQLPPDNKLKPVVLVRSAERNSAWWVQPSSTVDSRGRFQSPVHFGNEQSELGSHFRVVVLLVDDAELLKRLTPGKPIQELPAGVHRSREVRVILNQRAATK